MKEPLAGRHARAMAARQISCGKRSIAESIATLQNLEETLPPMTAEDFKRAASSNTASTGVRADGFHPKVPLGLSSTPCGNMVAFVAKMARMAASTSGSSATKVNHGGAERTTWETFLEMETYSYNVQDVDERAITLVVEVAK